MASSKQSDGGEPTSFAGYVPTDDGGSDVEGPGNAQQVCKKERTTQGKPRGRVWTEDADVEPYLLWQRSCSPSV